MSEQNKRDELENFKKKLRAFGINGDNLEKDLFDAFQELSGQSVQKTLAVEVEKIRAEIMKLVSDELKKTREELAKQIELKIEATNVDNMVNKVLERIPTSAAVDELKMTRTITEAVLESIIGILNKFKTEFGTQLQNIRDNNSKELEAHKEAILSQVKEAFVEMAGSGSAAGKSGDDGGNNKGGDVIDRLGPLFSLLQPKDDFNLDNLEKLLTLKQRLDSLFGGQGGPDPGTVYRANQAIFMEGIKIGARAKGVPALPGPKASSPSDGHLNSPGKKSTRINPLITRL